jgi:outer membrane lipoprotein-sorting protein
MGQLKVHPRLRAVAFALGVAACAAQAMLPVDTARAQAATASDPLHDFLSSTRSASGTFTQQVLRDARVVESSRGRFAFERPGRFRWEVTEPFEQLLVGDGERLYFYDKDLNQVTVRKLRDALASTPAAILFGSSDLESGFTLRTLPERDGLAWVEALPRNAETGYQRIEFGFRGGLPAAMQVQDAFGRTVRFEFHDVVRDPQLAPDAFRFVPPPGADVVGQ